MTPEQKLEEINKVINEFDTEDYEPYTSRFISKLNDLKYHLKLELQQIEKHSK